MRGRAEQDRWADRDAVVPATAVGDDVELLDLVKVILGQWLFIALVTALCVGAGFAYLFVAKPVYTATSRVLLEQRDRQVIGQEIDTRVQGLEAIWIDTQASLVLSQDTLAAVIRSEKLDQDPSFGRDFEEAMRTLAERLDVQRAEATYVLDIKYTGASAEEAARMSRAVSIAFVEALSRAKAAKAKEANALVAAQVEELRKKARDADEKLQAFRRENGLFFAGGQLVDETRLEQLNKALIAAEIAEKGARERRDSLRSMIATGGAGFDSAVDSLNSAVLSRLKIEYALASKDLAELSQQLGPSHPRMEAANAEIIRIRGLILEELRGLAETAQADYVQAERERKAAQAALEEAKAVMGTVGNATITARELENEASARIEVYRAFVARMEETARQQETQVSDARIITPAAVPDRPSAPRRTLVLALSGVVGLALGLSGALYRGRGRLAEIARSRAMQIGRADRSAFAPEPDHRPVQAPRRPVAAPRRQDDDQGPDRPPEAEAAILADLTVDTARSRPGASGRPIARSSQDILASAVECYPGRADERALAAAATALALTPGPSGGRLLAVIGRTGPGAAAAAAYALARAEAADGGDVLLIDAAEDGFAIADVFLDEAEAGILDVVTGEASADDIGAGDDGEGVTVMRLRGFSEETLAPRADRIAAFMRGLAEDFTLTIVHLGSDPDGVLLDAVAGVSDGQVAIVESSVDARTLSVLARLVPGFCGAVRVREKSRVRSAA